MEATNPATPAPKAKPAKKAAPAKERPRAKRPAATSEPAAHSEQLPDAAPAPAKPAETPAKPAKPKPAAKPKKAAAAKQEHEVQSAKEVANDAANIAHAAAAGLTKGSKLKAAKPGKPKRLSALDAAAIVLSKAGKPMKAAEMIEAMQSEGLWSSPGGKTPEATLYAAIIREIGAKKHESRFKKHDRGLFVAAFEGA